MYKFLIPFLVLLIGGPCAAQRDTIALNYDEQPLEIVEIKEADLVEYRADENYNYEPEVVDNSWWEGVKNWLYNILRRFFEWLFGVDAAPKYIAAFLKYIPYLLLGVLLFLLIRFLIKANTKNIIFSKTNPNLVVLSEEERILKTEDIQELIKRAFEQKEYRQAIRYYYLYLLKLLMERDLIDWQLQKTNDDYLQELSHSTLQPLFKKVTTLYDYIWYGEFEIDAKGYEMARNQFDLLKKSIATNV
ncbi:MAG: DUF4129 domain-containing protein [Bacteroidota bacterium]